MQDEIRVLIADDDPFSPEAMSGALRLDEEASFIVALENQPRKVLERVRAWRPHVLLLDDKFYGKNVGISQLLPEVRAQFPVIGIVIITAHRGDSLDPIARSLGYGIDGFLDKTKAGDIEPERLRAAVMQAYTNYKDRSPQ